MEGDDGVSVENYSQNGQEPEGLPLRWVVILSAAGVAGVSASLAASVIVGVGIALAVVGLLHRIVR